ncbi:hypothetical protein DFH06DRAFT_1299495 [Mycena polygramma]|nr:hypothetical protein DFH06DRAFT_1299495 [Mycena polygramma]
MYAHILSRGLLSRTLRTLPPTPNLRYRSLATVATVVEAAPRLQKPEMLTPVHPGSPQLDAFITAHFPVFPEELLPIFCSCDWAKWHEIDFFCVRQGWYNLSEAEFIFKHCFKIPGGLRPLAWRDLAAEPQVLVAIGTRYVLWNGEHEVLTRFPGRYSSDEDFFRRMMASGDILDNRGRRQDLPPSSAKIYRKVDTEQRALLRHSRPHKLSPPNWSESVTSARRHSFVIFLAPMRRFANLQGHFDRNGIRLRCLVFARANSHPLRLVPTQLMNFAHTSKSPSFTEDPRGSNTAWELRLAHIFGSEVDIVSACGPLAGRPSTTDIFPTDVYDQMATDRAAQEIDSLVHDIHTLQLDLMAKASEKIVADRFEACWMKHSPHEREEFILEGLVATCGLSSSYEDWRAWCPELTLKRLNDRSGEGYINIMHDLTLPASRKPKEVPDSYMTILNAVFDTMISPTAHPGSVMLQRMIQGQRTYFLTMVVWHVLLIFYGEPTQFGSVKQRAAPQKRAQESL